MAQPEAVVLRDGAEDARETRDGARRGARRSVQRTPLARLSRAYAPRVEGSSARASDAHRCVEGSRARARPTRIARCALSEVTVPSSSIVVGDIVVLGVGDVAPADLRLLEARGQACV